MARSASIVTSLSTRDCADAFRETATTAMAGDGRFGKVMRGMYRTLRPEFFTPHDSSPFSGLDDNPPTFSVGAQWATKPLPVTLHMYVWDRKKKGREVNFVAPHGVRQGFLEKFTDAIFYLDEECEVSFD